MHPKPDLNLNFDLNRTLGDLDLNLDLNHAWFKSCGFFGCLVFLGSLVFIMVFMQTSLTALIDIKKYSKCNTIALGKK